MALTQAQLKAREGKLTGSRVACLMRDDQAKMLNLWRELVGDPLYVPEDISQEWFIRLGELTEPLNLEWVEKKYGQIDDQGRVMVHPAAPWAACTLDGWLEQQGMAVECKHCGGYESLATVIERYQPQLHWTMLVTNTKRILLSIIFGNKEPYMQIIEFDPEYGAELWHRAEMFMDCVWSLRPPVPLPPMDGPVLAEKVYDMKTNNAWAHHAHIWQTNRPFVDKFEDAKSELKAIIPLDAKRAHGHGIEATRNKAGAITIKEIK